MGYNINGLDDLSENLKKLAEKGVSELNKGLDKLNNDINAKNEKTFKFYAPPHKSSEDVYLEFAPLALDKDLDEYYNNLRNELK